MLELKSNSIEYQVPGSAPVTLATYTGGTPSGTELVFLPPADADHVTLARTVPSMDFICVNENRMWGCKGDTIYIRVSEVSEASDQLVRHICSAVRYDQSVLLHPRSNDGQGARYAHVPEGLFLFWV